MRPSYPAQVLISIPPVSNQCAPVTLTTTNITYGPTSTTYTIQLSTTTPGAHIFYTVDTTGVGIDPTHTGDNATGVTIRIGSNSGIITVNVHTAKTTDVRALAYQSGLNDSIISDDSYDGPAGP